MAIILPQGSPPDRVQQIFIALWYLWKANNDLRFNNTKWTIAKVHYETNAAISVATNPLFVVDDQPWA